MATLKLEKSKGNIFKRLKTLLSSEGGFGILLAVPALLAVFMFWDFACCSGFAGCLYFGFHSFYQFIVAEFSTT
jgi:hypothetical protein